MRENPYIYILLLLYIYKKKDIIWLLYLVGSFNPFEKYESQLGLLFPIYGKIKNIPNHQPDEMHPGLALDLFILGTKWDYLPSGKPT